MPASPPSASPVPPAKCFLSYNDLADLMLCRHLVADWNLVWDGVLKAWRPQVVGVHPVGFQDEHGLPAVSAAGQG